MDSRPNLLLTWPTGLPMARVTAAHLDDDPGLYGCVASMYDSDADTWQTEATHTTVKVPFDCLVLGPCAECREMSTCPILRRIAFGAVGMRDERYVRVKLAS